MSEKQKQNKQGWKYKIIKGFASVSGFGFDDLINRCTQEQVNGK